MDDLVISRLLHVIAVVFWIGGVAMVTTVILPDVRTQGDAAAKLELFERIERRFGWQARWSTLLAGASGLYMLIRLELWDRFSMTEFWWLHAMVGVWSVFTVVIFVLEPWFLGNWFRRYALASPERAFAAAIWLHRILLSVSLLTIAGAVAGSH